MEMYSAAWWERREDEQWGFFNTFEAKPVCIIPLGPPYHLLALWSHTTAISAV